MGGNTRFLMGALAVAASAVAALAQNAPLFQFTEKPGPHFVGLKVVEPGSKRPQRMDTR
jgi:hypothetical protein